MRKKENKIEVKNQLTFEFKRNSTSKKEAKIIDFNSRPSKNELDYKDWILKNTRSF